MRLDILSALFKDLGELMHQRKYGLSVREVRLLLQIHHNPGLTMTQLVDLTYMDKTITSRAVTSLSQKGLVQRLVGEQDARQVNLVLTARGEELALEASSSVTSHTEKAMSELSSKERDVFDRALDLLTHSARAALERELSNDDTNNFENQSRKQK